MENALKVSTFKERFSALADENKKNTIALAKELHVSNQTISAWKTGSRSPKEPTIIAIADHFGVTVEWLMGFDVEKEAPNNNDRKLPVFIPNTEMFVQITRHMSQVDYEMVIGAFERTYQKMKDKGLIDK